MLQLRPTFSESWYRVAALKPKLRAGAQISRQFYRGDRWYVVRDPAGNQYHRLSDAAYRFVGLPDGRRSIEEAWDLVGGQLADDAPTQPEVIQILSQLYAANLLETDVPPAAPPQGPGEGEDAGGADECALPAHSAVGPRRVP